jgi:hypothetical protein
MVFVAGPASRRDHQFVVCIFHATDGALWRDSTYRARDCDETERYRPRQSSPAPIFFDELQRDLFVKTFGDRRGIERYHAISGSQPLKKSSLRDFQMSRRDARTGAETARH